MNKPGICLRIFFSLKSSVKIVCKEKFISIEFLERGLSVSMGYRTTEPFRSPARLGR